MKPQLLGTIWATRARIQQISDDETRWVTLAECMDTPNAIKAEVTRLAASGCDVTTLWVHGTVTARKMVVDL